METLLIITTIVSIALAAWAAGINRRMNKERDDYIKRWQDARMDCWLNDAEISRLKKEINELKEKSE